MVVESHNVLSKDDLILLYRSPWLSRDLPHGFQARIIFDIALVTAMRPTAMATMQVRQVKKIMIEGENVWTITGVVGSRLGASKTSVGGWNADSDRPNKVFNWDRDGFDVILNVYKDIDDYINVRASIDSGSDRLFLAINLNGKKMMDFFKRQHLGHKMFSQIIKEVCRNAGVAGTGFANSMTAYGLRGTVVTQLFELGCADAAVAMRTGQRDLRYFKNYHIMIDY